MFTSRDNRFALRSLSQQVRRQGFTEPLTIAPEDKADFIDIIKAQSAVGKTAAAVGTLNTLQLMTEDRSAEDNALVKEMLAEMAASRKANEAMLAALTAQNTSTESG